MQFKNRPQDKALRHWASGIFSRLLGQNAIKTLQLAQFIGSLPIYLNGYLHHSYSIYCILYDLLMIVLFRNLYLRVRALSGRRRISSSTTWVSSAKKR